MPKRIFAFAFAIGALALAACNNNSSLYTVAATPTPTATPVPTPNPAASTATVYVTYSASPLPNQPVTLSTPDANGHYTGAVILTQTTDSTGKTVFSNLKATTSYCFASTYTPPGALPRTIPICTNLWGNGTAALYMQF